MHMTSKTEHSGTPAMTEASVPTAPAPVPPSRGLETVADAIGAAEAAAGDHLLDVLRTADRQCRRLLQCRTVRIWIARRGGARLVAQEFPADGDGPPVEQRLARGEGLAGWVLAQRTPLRLPSEADPVFQGRVPAYRSALAIPLDRRGEVFAAIECLDPLNGERFTAAHLTQLQSLGEQIALALDNALLYQGTERRAREKEVMLEVSRTLAAPLDLDEVLDAFLKSLREVVRYDSAAVYLVNRTTLALEQVRAVGYPEGCDDALGLRVGVGLVGWVAKTGEAVLVPDVSSDPRYVAARPGTRSELAAPLQIQGRTIGVFNLESDVEDAYHEGHLEILSAFASQAAVAVERARLTRELLERRHLEKELAIAREIQSSFLPKQAPEVPGFDLAGTARTHAEVGGDYYDFIRVSDTRLGLAIADVSGKGIPAALLMAGFRTSLLAEIRNEFAIRAVMRKVNSLVYESTDRGKFVTAFYGLLDFRNRVLTFSNAGHNPPILVRRDGTIEQLLEGGVAFGVLPDAHYEERPLALRPGDVLGLYTDGISEAESPSGEHFGQRRVEQRLAALADKRAAEILDGLVEAAENWAGERGLNDDLTVMVVKVLD
jgi:sigma-B regulation protein RsbU (phosphoserine phosphatase)